MEGYLAYNYQVSSIRKNASIIRTITSSLTARLLHSTRHTSEKNLFPLAWVLHACLHWKRGLLPFPALADLEPLVLLCIREFSSARSLSGRPPFSAAPDEATAPAPASPAGFRWLGCNTVHHSVSQQWAQPALRLTQKTMLHLPDQSSDPSGLTSEVGRTCLSGLQWPLHQGSRYRTDQSQLCQQVMPMPTIACSWGGEHLQACGGA